MQSEIRGLHCFKKAEVVVKFALLQDCCGKFLSGKSYGKLTNFLRFNCFASVLAIAVKVYLCFKDKDTMF